MPPKRKFGFTYSEYSSSASTLPSADGNASAISNPDKRARSSSKPSTSKPITFSDALAAPDVAVDILGEAYHLHSTVLRLCSEFFDRSMSQNWWKAENTHDGPDGIKYRYALVLDRKSPRCSIVEPVSAASCASGSAFTRKELFGMLVEVPGGGEGEEEWAGCGEHVGDSIRVPQGYHMGGEGFAEAAGEAAEEEGEKEAAEVDKNNLATTYFHLFSIFYHKPIFFPLDKSENIDELQDLVDLAEVYCALPTVSSPVYQQIVTWIATGGRVTKYLQDIITIAVKIQSKSLFNDAYIHFVGKWNVGQHRRVLPEGVKRLIELEYMRIQEIKLHVHRKLGTYMHFPPAGFYDGHLIPPMLAEFESSHNEAALYRKLAKIKGPIIAPLVESLVVSNLELTPPTALPQHRHLTCARKLTDKDYPWAGNPFH